MKVLLVGFGDLARRLAPKLQSAGMQVSGLRRGGDGFPGVSMVRGDCRQPALLAGAMAGMDAVVVTLTPSSFTEEAYRATYVDGAVALGRALSVLSDRPGYLVWASSTSVYGSGRGEWVDETSPVMPAGFSGQCLLEAEHCISDLPIATSIVRFSGIYGPGRHQLLAAVRRGDIAGPEPEVWTNRIHSEDCAGVFRHLLQAHRDGSTNPALLLATDCCPATRHEVQTWLAAQLAVTPKVGGPAAPVRGNRRCSNRLLLASGFRFLYPDFRSGYAALLAGC